MNKASYDNGRCILENVISNTAGFSFYLSSRLLLAVNGFLTTPFLCGAIQMQMIEVRLVMLRGCW